jgi:hypothetical protein
MGVVTSLKGADKTKVIAAMGARGRSGGVG